MGWTPRDFWGATPTEFALACEAYRAKERSAWTRIAWLAAHLLNIWRDTKKRKAPITAAELLGEKPRSQQAEGMEMFSSREEFIEGMRSRQSAARLRKALGGKL